MFCIPTKIDYTHIVHCIILLDAEPLGLGAVLVLLQHREGRF